MATPEGTAILGNCPSASRAIGAIFFTLVDGAWLAFGILAAYGIRLMPLKLTMAGA